MKTHPLGRVHLEERFRRALVAALVLLPILFVQPAKGFALLGPYAEWMTETNGFTPNDEIGGPMNIDEGYRWNVPVVTYAFDSSFVDFFGSNGVAAVESAIHILNDLPAASQIDVNSYPLDTTGVNFVAESTSLVDLKSTALFLLLQQLGLAQPTRFVYCVHDFSITNNAIIASILQRNFDPFSFAPSQFVNGVKFEYSLGAGFGNDGQFYIGTTSYPKDPSGEAFTAVADYGGFYYSELAAGNFYTGLTRDDVGGLRYLLATNNYKFEALLSDVHGAGTNAGSYVNLALRAGVDKITFVRQDHDSLSGSAYVPVTNRFIDTYVNNKIVTHQQLERIVATPDIVFSVAPSVAAPNGCARTGTSNWLNNSVLNGSPDLEGPGIIRPPINITFQHQVSAFADTGDTQQSSASTIRWGSFDNSTNAPTDYPTDTFQGQIDTLEVDLQLWGKQTSIAFPAITNLDYPSPTNLTFSSTLTSQIFNWELPVAYGHGAIIQTSTNLVDWAPQLTITNYGLPIWWMHWGTSPRLFLRVVPQTNSP